ncbi:N-acetyltransferase [Mycobacterium sp. SMC-4]|uniref:GNAT family N-acetyltransferase n=1 Tax=Mycobacterium sp. SMC-4 TaxID=2857059 RepID=UPI0021B413A2|nr:GNAT family N-acetyltransferase [Mycobacterium sp. SMC-4]UXA16056.1 GNAT family N-acetyltransferase [Mycobacterium sp. SMC-4]
MVEVREILTGKTGEAADALLELRPRWKTPAALVDFVDSQLRPAGYRIVGAFEPGSAAASSALGFREAHSTAWGHYVYVDDLSTVSTARGRGHADLLLRWVIAEAQRLGCEAVHLDSGVGPDRAAAHRLYMRHHLQITSHHFTIELGV